MPGERADNKQSASEVADFEWPPRPEDLDRIFVRVDAIGDVAPVDAGWRRENDSTHRTETADHRDRADRAAPAARRMVEDHRVEISEVWPEIVPNWAGPSDERSVPRRSHGRQALLVAATLMAAVVIGLPWFLVWRSGESSAVSPQPATSTEVASVVPPILSLPAIRLPFEFSPAPRQAPETQSAATAIAELQVTPEEAMPAPPIPDVPSPATSPSTPARSTAASGLPSPPASPRPSEASPPAAAAPPPAIAAPAPATAAPASAGAAPPPVVTPPAPPVATPSPPRPATATKTASLEASPSPPAAAPTDEGLVTTTLRRYALAYEQLDVSAVSTVWPGADGRALKRAFDAIEYQQVTMDRCNVRVSGATAVAGCDGWISYVPKVGKKDPRTLARRWDFELEKDGGAWKITTAAVR